MNPLVVTICRWLSLLGVSIEEAYVRQRLLSHPDYPSAFAITSLLDELGIENAAVQIDKEQAHELATPFLAFVGGEDFILVTSLKAVEHTVHDFWSRWDGIAVLAEKPEHVSEPEALQNIKRDEKAVRVKWAFAAALVVLLGMLAAIRFSMSDSLLFIVNLTGLVVCGSLVLRELGMVSALSKRLCGESITTGCDTVLGSKAATVLPGIKLSDAGVAFFAGVVTIVLVVSVGADSFVQSAQTLLSLAFFAGIPVTLYSLYYQRQVARTWCRSCLAVVALLWTNVFVQTIFATPWQPVQSMDFVMAALLFILPGALWILVRHVLNRRQELDQQNLRLQRFYRTPELFRRHLLAQPEINTVSRPYDFVMGNPDAPCRLVVVSSHFCGPCVDTFKVLQRLLLQGKDAWCITVRFLDSNPQNHNGRKASVQRHMLQYALSVDGFLKDPEKVERMLEAWYASRDIDTFRKLYPVKNFIDVDFILERQREWGREAGITHTPTILVNGRRIEAPYGADDLLEFGAVLLELFGTPASAEEEAHEDQQLTLA